MDNTVHGILQTRILEWVAFLFSRESSQPRDWTQVSRITCRFFTSWATREDWFFTSLFFLNIQFFIHGFPCGSAGKESACNVGDLGLIPGLGRFPGEGKGYPLQYSGLENSMDCIVHGITNSRTRLSDFDSWGSQNSWILEIRFMLVTRFLVNP